MKTAAACLLAGTVSIHYFEPKVTKAKAKQTTLKFAHLIKQTKMCFICDGQQYNKSSNLSAKNTTIEYFN